MAPSAARLRTLRLPPRSIDRSSVVVPVPWMEILSHLSFEVADHRGHIRGGMRQHHVGAIARRPDDRFMAEVPDDLIDVLPAAECMRQDENRERLAAPAIEDVRRAAIGGHAT